MRNKEKIIVSSEVKTILYDLFNQIQYELIEQYEEFKKENEKLKEQVDRYKRLIEYLKKLDFYEFDLDYDYEENPIDNYYPANMEYHINNWLANEELESDE